MAEGAGRGALFGDGRPVRVADLDAVVGDDAVARRVDGPGTCAASGRSGGLRLVTGSRFGPSDWEWLELLVCFEPLWELSLQYDAILDASAAKRSGRRREYTTFEAVLLDAAAWTWGSYQRAADNLADKRLWEFLRATVEAAFPDDDRMRLSPSPITRAQNYRFRKQHATPDFIEAMRHRIEAAAVEACREMGMLNPAAGSLTNPDKRCFVAGDGTWIPALTKLTRQDATDPVTGEVCGRYDPDAIPYHTSDGQFARSPGMLTVLVLARNPHPKERIILATRVKSAANPDMARNDATVATDMTLELMARHPELRGRIVGFIYDMALSAADQDRILDAGVIPVCKVALTPQGRHPAVPLGEHTFTTRRGQSVHLNITAVAGTPCITQPDGDGEEHYLPLRLVQVKEEPRKRRPLITTRWAIGDDPLAPPHLHGAVCRIRHTRTAAERRNGQSRSRALRVIPPSDERFNNIFGLREDTESTNSDLKNRLPNRRSRTIGHNSVEFNTLAYQTHVLVTALAAYHHRTGADLHRWFGQHTPSARAGPHTRLAA